MLQKLLVPALRPRPTGIGKEGQEDSGEQEEHDEGTWKDFQRQNEKDRQ